MEDNKITLEQNEELKANTSTEEKKEPATILNEPSIFESDATVQFMTGAQLREKINTMFRSVFVDYEGCRLQINDNLKPDVIVRSLPVGSIYVDLIFRENEASGFHMLKRRSETKGSSMLSRLNHTIGGDSARAYVLDEDGLESLEEFLPGFNKKNRKKVTMDAWRRRIFESQVSPANGAFGQGFYGASYIDVAVLGFPIESMLKKIFGDENNGDHFDYACQLMRETLNKDVIVQITQMKTSTVNKLYNMIGIDRYSMTTFSGANFYQPMNGPAGFGIQNYQ